MSDWQRHGRDSRCVRRLYARGSGGKSSRMFAIARTGNKKRRQFEHLHLTVSFNVNIETTKILVCFSVSASVASNVTNRRFVSLVYNNVVNLAFRFPIWSCPCLFIDIFSWEVSAANYLLRSRNLLFCVHCHLCGHANSIFRLFSRWKSLLSIIIWAFKPPTLSH